MRTRRLGVTLLLLGLVAPGLASCTGEQPGQVAAHASGSTGSHARRVVVVSIDGLNPAAVDGLRTPALARIIREGAGTLDARTEVERTDTLPNHTGMVTGRRVEAGTGGHGVTWNDGEPQADTVQQAAGGPVSSVFRRLEQEGREAGLFVGKAKLRLFERSWPNGVDRTVVVRDDDRRLMEVALRDLVHRRRALTFVHLKAPDSAGHRHGFMSGRYLRAVHRTDLRLARLLEVLDRRPRFASRTAVLVTADHGGAGDGHGDPGSLANFRVPFLVRGPGVAVGADLYALNPDYADPGEEQVPYDAPRQPVRNGAVANVTLHLLGLAPVPGSEHDAGQDLDVS